MGASTSASTREPDDRTSGHPWDQAADVPQEQADAWHDMSRQLNIYDSATGWEGPNELLICGASRGSS